MNTVSSRHSTEKSLAIKIQLRQRAQKWPQNFKRGCLVRLRPPLFRYLDNYLLIFNCDVNFSLGKKKKTTTTPLSHINKRSCFSKQFPKFNRGIKQEFNSLRFKHRWSLLSLQKLQEAEILNMRAEPATKGVWGQSMKAESRRLSEEESSRGWGRRERCLMFI